MTGFRQMVRSMVRERMLDAASASVAEEGWGKLRLAEVARRAEFSRQTVYNEFGSKEALGAALVERELERFLAGIREQIEPERSIHAAARAGVEFTLRLAAADGLVKSILLAGRGGESELLSYLTTRARPMFETATGMLMAHAAEAWPAIDEESRSLAIEAAVRLTVSHIVQPSGALEESALRIAEIVRRVAGVRD